MFFKDNNSKLPAKSTSQLLLPIQTSNSTSKLTSTKKSNSDTKQKKSKTTSNQNTVSTTTTATTNYTNQQLSTATINLSKENKMDMSSFSTNVYGQNSTNSYSSQYTPTGYSLSQYSQNVNELNNIYYQHNHQYNQYNQYSQAQYTQQAPQVSQAPQTQAQIYNQTNHSQYYYYPTPESSPDVQFQLLNDAAVLNAATQHLFASANPQTSFLANSTSSSNSFSKRSNSSASPSSSSSPLSHHSFSQPIAKSQTSPSTQNNYINSYNNTASYSAYNPHYENQLETQSLLSSQPSEDISPKVSASANWYMSAAVAAAAVTNPFLYQSDEHSTQAANNSYSFHQKF